MIQGNWKGEGGQFESSSIGLVLTTRSTLNTRTKKTLFLVFFSPINLLSRSVLHWSKISRGIRKNCGGYGGGNFWTIVGLNNFCGINRARVPIFHSLSLFWRSWRSMEVRKVLPASWLRRSRVCVCFFQSLGGSSILLNSPIRFLESVCIMHFQTNVTTKRSYQAALG